jgi:hypothetical protein
MKYHYINEVKKVGVEEACIACGDVRKALEVLIGKPRMKENIKKMWAHVGW